MGEGQATPDTPDEPHDPRSAPTGSAKFFHQTDPRVLRTDTPGITALAPLPERIGHYRIIRIIGEGGMGMVLQAEQDKPKRIVALKVILPGVAKPEMIRRFADESEMLGLLQHPGIAQIYEAGVFDSSGGGGGAQPYFAMEFVRGKPLTQYAREHHLGTRERLQLMIKICEAVQHAHQKGIIHRDLKPSNILVVDDELPSRDAHGLQSVGVAAGKAQPKILDFGVARLTASDIQSTTLRTDIGQLIGTIPYMSPEQTEGDPRNLDTRSDVYALGVICYELLADRLPYDLQQKMIHEAVRVIREDDPTPLSSVNRVFRGDVETIVAKALEKDRERRYQSATELASDIERYLKDEAIVARPASRSYQLRKFASRNKALVGGVAATFVALIAGLVVSLYLLGVARANERTAKYEATQRGIAEKAERQRADELAQVAEFQSEMVSNLDPQTMGRQFVQLFRTEVEAGFTHGGVDPAQIESDVARFETLIAAANATNVAVTSLDDHILVRAEESARQQFAEQPAVLAALLQTIASTRQSLGLYDRALPIQHEAMDIRRRVLGDGHEDTFKSINETARLLAARGNLAQAEPLQQLVVALTTEHFGPDHVGTLTAIGNLAALLEKQNKPTQAEPYFRQAMEGCRRVLGIDHLNTLVSINNMGFILLQLKQWEESEKFLRESFDASLLYLGEDHTNTIHTLGNLAQLLESTNRSPEADTTHHRAITIARRFLGDNHTDTLRAICNHAMFLMRAQHYAEAEALAREAADRSRSTLGDSNPETHLRVMNLAEVLQEAGKHPEAQQHFEFVLHQRRALHGDDDRATIEAVQSLANHLRLDGKPAEAEPYAREAVERARRILGNQDPQTWRAVNVLGTVLQTLGKTDEAEPLVREALEQRRANLGEDDPETLRSYHNYAALLHKQKNYTQAKEYLAKAIRGRSRRLSPDHPTTLSSRYALGTILWEQGARAEAQIELQAVVDGRRKFLPPGDHELMNAIQNLARLEAQLGHFHVGETLALEVINLLDAANRQPARAWRSTLNDLGNLYDAWHAAEPGKGYDFKAAEWKAKLAELQAATQPAASPTESQPASSRPAAHPASTQATSSPGSR